MPPRDQVYWTHDIAAALRGLAYSFAVVADAEVLSGRAQRDAQVRRETLDAVGLVLDVGDWREENRDGKRT